MERAFNTHFYRLSSASWFKRHQAILTSFFGQTPLNEIGMALISEFKEQRVKKGLSASYVNRSLAVLRKSLNLAYEWEWIDKPVLVRLFSEPPGKDRWINQEEERQILDVCPRWLKEIVITSLYSGMRLSEVLSLQWEYIDLDRQVIYVFKSKNRDRRSIPLHPKIYSILKDKERLSPFVFVNRHLKPYPNYRICQSLKLRLDRINARDISFHTMRHTFASRLAMANISLLKIQRLLGHKSLSMTMRYAHHSVDSLRDAISQLS